MSVRINIKKEVNISKLISEIDNLGFHSFSSIPDEFIVVEDAGEKDSVAITEVYNNHTPEVTPEETLDEKIDRIVTEKVSEVSVVSK